MAFCRKCGTKINDDASFCCGCGAPSDGQPVAQQTSVQIQPVAYGYVKPKTPGRGLGIAGMVLGIIGLVYTFVMMVNVIEYVDSYARYFIGSSLDDSIFTAIVICSIFSILAVSLAGSGRHKGYKTGVSTSGIVMGVIGLAMSLISLIVIASA